MQLIIDISRFCFLRHKRKDVLKLLLVTSLKSRRIVENKSGVALEYERPINIMYPSLVGVGVRHTRRYL